jgi:hypothetical protein
VNCNQFQNQIVKKSNKWICKLCSTKQSLQQVFATGPSIDCRKVVQQLNLGQGEIEQSVKAAKIARFDQAFQDQADQEDYSSTANSSSFRTGESRSGPDSEESTSSTSFYRVVPKERSKWAKYFEDQE